MITVKKKKMYEITLLFDEEQMLYFKDIVGSHSTGNQEEWNLANALFLAAEDATRGIPPVKNEDPPQ